jgi:hypothetical protein
MKSYKKKVVEILHSTKEPRIEHTVIRYNNNQTIKHINEWFNKGIDGDIAPIHTVFKIAKKFSQYLEEYNLTLNMNYSTFFSKLCGATCTLALHKNSKVIGMPRSIPQSPANWSTEIEIIWNDYIESFYLTIDFWDSFWKSIDTGIWELRLSQFRNYLQSILPLFIKRDLQLLIDMDLIAENSEGKYVDIHDAELDIPDEYADE